MPDKIIATTTKKLKKEKKPFLIFFRGSVGEMTPLILCRNFGLYVYSLGCMYTVWVACIQFGLHVYSLGCMYTVTVLEQSQLNLRCHDSLYIFFQFCFAGAYMFMESSAPRKSGDKTWFLSQPFPAFSSGTKCFHFWYHMYGAGIGEIWCGTAKIR